MNWTMVLVVTLVIVLSRWKKKEFHILSFLKELLVFCIFLYIIGFIGKVVGNYLDFSFSLSDILSETMQLWIGGTLIFLYACFLAIKGWRTGRNRRIQVNKN